jgi:alditol oxidase
VLVTTNWAGNLTFRAAHVHRPSSLEELRRLVARSPQIRALGSGHSFSDIADTTGDLVSLAEMPAGIEPDGAAGRVRVGAAVRYAELGRRLHEHGLAVHNLASLPHISVAGSVATATHGSGDRNGNLATVVAAIELVTADGDLVTLSRGEPDFDGAVVGLGALGVVTALTLDVQPAFEVRQFVYDDLALDTLDFELVMSSAYSVSLFTDWRAPRINQVWVKQRADEAREPEPEWFGATLADGPRHPVPGMSPVHCTEQLGVPGPSFERLPHFRPDFTPSSGEELQSEFLVPRRNAAAVLRELDKVRDHIAPVLQIAEVRTIAADTLWMSPAYGTDIVGFHFTWIADYAAVLPVLTKIEERVQPYDAKPHWGKLFTAAPRYERQDDFQRLVRSYDPAGKFANDFVRRHVMV